MYWPEHTFLPNDFGKPLKKHIKGLCSAWAQLLLCFLSAPLSKETANLRELWENLQMLKDDCDNILMEE